MSASTLQSFPNAQQAQIIRANQRDLIQVSSLREQTDSFLRSSLGTRWLTRWDKEVDLITKLTYFGLTTGRATQTLGEEYTDLWQHSALALRTPAVHVRIALILLPTLPPYLLSRYRASLSARSPKLAALLRVIPIACEALSEINLAIFYLWGVYYDVAKRLFGIKYLTLIPQNPHTRPPSYSLLGVLLAVRLLYRLRTFIKNSRPEQDTALAIAEAKQSSNRHETFIDDRPVSSLIIRSDPDNEIAKPAEEDERTILDIPSISDALRQRRNCTLCLEERTDSCATECGHLFCWGCIIGWGREKAECPLCRQSLSLTRLLPVYNL